MDAPDSFQSAVGKFLSAYRVDHELTLDQIARAARTFGVAWGTQSVRNIQTGNATPTLPTLITLALALNQLTGEKLTLSDLLGDAEAIGPPTALGLPFSRPWVEQVLQGGVIEVGNVTTALVGGADKQDEILRNTPEALAAVLETVKAEFPPGLGFRELEQFGRELRRDPSLAERRAADRLHVSPEAVIYWSAHLWGRSLDDEARARAGQDASPQARGAVTRRLVEEISTNMAEHLG